MTNEAEIYLTKAEIERLTGRRYAKYQRQILAERGWQFEVDGDGQPLVLRELHDARLGKTLDSKKPPSPRRGPRLEGLSSRRPFTGRR